MSDDEKDQLVRRYAAGEISWSMLRRVGLDDFAEVLELLGARGLRPPLASMEGPNVESRLRGRDWLRSALQKADT